MRMDDLVRYGVLSVALFYVILAGIAAGVLYGLYILAMAFVTGNYTTVLQVLPLLVILVLIYGVTGRILKRRGII
jgi:hypothetical protein